METPLSPLDFARRARKLHPNREAVVDGDRRYTYTQFLDRCDRWSSALQQLGVKQGDRVATIAPNTHSHLEAFYAVPQIGAVLVPCNYRLTASDFVYLINHSGSTVVCAHRTTSMRLTAFASNCRTSGTSWRSKAPAPAGWITKRPLLPHRRNSCVRKSPKPTC